MAMIRGKSTSYTWPVTFERECDGGVETIEFTARFKHLTRTRQSELLGEIFEGRGGDSVREELRVAGEESISEAEKKRITDEDVISEVMIGWVDVREADGSDIEFTTENRIALFEEYARARSATVVAWADSITGGALKNSKPSPEAGPAAENQ